MKTTLRRFAPLAAIAVTGLLISACASPGAGSALTKASVVATVPVTINLKGMNQGLSAVLASRLHSNSRAMMFVTRYDIAIENTNTSDWTYPDAVPQPGDPGNSKPTIINLAPGTAYNILITAYNSGYDSYPVSIGYAKSFTPTQGGDNYVSVNLTPYSPELWTSPSSYPAAAADLMPTDNWYPPLPISSTIVPDGSKLYATNMASGDTSGGERWYEVTVPDGSPDTMTITIDPQVNGLNDPNAIILAATFDSAGGQLGGFAMSPNLIFSTTSSSSDPTVDGSKPSTVTFSVGVTPGDTFYLGYLVLTMGGTIGGTAGYDEVQITASTPVLSDDSYESSTLGGYTFENDASWGAYVFDQSLTSSSPIKIEAKAYDPDWYQFSAIAGKTYKVSLHTGWTLPVASLGWDANGVNGEIKVQLQDINGDMMNVPAKDMSNKNVKSLMPDGSSGNFSFVQDQWITFTAPAGSSGAYYLGVTLNGRGTPGFPILGGDYTVTVSQQP
ncbi:MAG: hypothetical protein ACOYM2_03415 [Rectinemataceae bacterium]